MKTLKDIKGLFPMYLPKQKEIILIGNPTKDAIDRYDKAELVEKEELRQSAIETIKFMDNTEFKQVCDKFGFEMSNECVGARKILMWRYNLKEDDLR